MLETHLVWRTDFNNILMDCHKNGKLVIQGLGPRKRAPKHGNTICLTAPRQFAALFGNALY